MDRDLVVAVGGDALDVAVPRLARVAAQLLLALAGQQVEGADDVLGGEGLAVVPLHALLQLEGEILVVGAPAPRLGEVGDDGLRAVLRLALVVEHQVVEQRHEGDDRRVGRLLVDRGAGRIVAMIHFQHAAALLGERNAIRTHQGSREAAQQDDRTHGRSLPWRAACRAAASRIQSSGEGWRGLASSGPRPVTIKPPASVAWRASSAGTLPRRSASSCAGAARSACRAWPTTP